MILVTGSEGLIGRHVCARLEAMGRAVRRFDLRRDRREDVRRAEALEASLRDVTGVLHLAAVTRVDAGEADPANCEATNVDALHQLLTLCLGRMRRPWVVFASSREVYGTPTTFPASEDADLKPMNVYARSKVRGEAMVQAAREAGLRAGICRLSSVYGCVADHPDRVAMAFAGVAARGGAMRVDGSDCEFDFTAVRDVAIGLCRLIDAMESGEQLPPIHFVSGRGVRLGMLATLAGRLARAPFEIIEAPARTYDVSRFIGDPTRARALLGWQADTSIEQGMARLVADLSMAVGPSARAVQGA